MPVRAPSVSISLSSYPLLTVIGALLSIAAIAAVTEEIAFRGYMQKPLEVAYGIVPAVLIVGIMFWVAHLDHGITITHLPFQMSASIALGLLVYLTRSLIPAMIAHGAAALLLQWLTFPPSRFVWKALSHVQFGRVFPQHFWQTINNQGQCSAHVCRRPIQIFNHCVDSLISAVLTVFAFLNLIRATRSRTVTPALGCLKSSLPLIIQ
jgi:hypothetical protein